jgi:hypothetical protein
VLDFMPEPAVKASETWYPRLQVYEPTHDAIILARPVLAC